MDRRTSREAVTFARPFTLRGIDGERPAGTYLVETDEELIPGLSFIAWRRVATVMFLPSRPMTRDTRTSSFAIRRDGQMQRAIGV